MAQKKSKSLEDALDRLGKRMDKCSALKPGDIDLHVGGPSGGEYRIQSGQGRCSIAKAAGRGSGLSPLFEVWGDDKTIRAIVDGEKDPVKQFLTGAMRVRGNLRYLSDIGVELGLLKKPL